MGFLQSSLNWVSHIVGMVYHISWSKSTKEWSKLKSSLNTDSNMCSQAVSMKLSTVEDCLRHQIIFKAESITKECCKEEYLRDMVSYEGYWKIECDQVSKGPSIATIRYLIKMQDLIFMDTASSNFSICGVSHS